MRYPQDSEKQTGDLIIIMDCDLQDDLVHFNKLYNETGKAMMLYSQKEFQENIPVLFKSVTAKNYNSLFVIFADNYDLNVSSMTMINRRVRDEFIKLKDQDRLYIQLIKWIGFKSTYMSLLSTEKDMRANQRIQFPNYFYGYAGWTSYSRQTFTTFNLPQPGIIYFIYYFACGNIHCCELLL